jgi:putative tricarboxylic transport membrane protein
MKLKVIFLAACAALLAPAPAVAQWKPDKRIEFVIPNAPGGGNDRLVRLAHKIMQDNRLVDPVVNVVHKPGAGVVMGMTYLNQHPGDGHYIAIVSSTLLGDYVTGRSTIGPADITPVAQLMSEYVGFAVKPDSSLKTGKDLIARQKSEATGVSMSLSGGLGNHNHIALALITRAAGGDVRKLKTVVYNSGADAITAALGGHVDVVASPAATVLPHVQAGRLRFLAITAPKRLEGAFADVPTWRELGANAVVSNWRAIVGPRGMTREQLAYWEGVFARVVESDEWKKMLQAGMQTGEFLRSAETVRELKAEQDDLRSIMGELGLTKDSK